jgi:uncharacterized repeat protein (TIGR02059 family)
MDSFTFTISDGAYLDQATLNVIIDGTDNDLLNPVLTSATTSIDGKEVILTYNEVLSTTTATSASFSVTTDGVNNPVTAVSISGQFVHLTLTNTVMSDQIITVDYTDPTSSNDPNAVQDASGNDTDSLSAYSVTNKSMILPQENKVILLGMNNSNDRSTLYADIRGLRDIDLNQPVHYEWLGNGETLESVAGTEGAWRYHSDPYYDWTQIPYTENNIFSYQANMSSRGYWRNNDYGIQAKVTYTSTTGELKTEYSNIAKNNYSYIYISGEDGSLLGANQFAPALHFNRVYPENYDGPINNDRELNDDLAFIKSTKASDKGIEAREGDYFIEFYADSSLYDVTAVSQSNPYVLRTEIANSETIAAYKEGYVFESSYSFYAPSSDWNEATKYSTLINQWKEHGGATPEFGIRLSNNGDYKVLFQAFDQALNGKELFTINPDTWVDVKTKTYFKTNNTGYLKVWIDDTLVVDYKGITLSYQAGLRNTDDWTFSGNGNGYNTLGMYTGIRDERSIYFDAIEWNIYLDDITSPTFSAAATSTDGTKVILTYNEALSSTTAAAADFTVMVDGSTASISSVTTFSSTVELTLSQGITSGQTVTVNYTDPSSGDNTNAIQDSVGNDADSLSNTVVTNNSTAYIDEDGDGVRDSLDTCSNTPSGSVVDATGCASSQLDSDGDGVADSSDAFPLDSSESVDTDSDGVGNNADSDDDGDGVADSSDAFPLDSSESIDTDSDGVGNNADSDDDNDGVLDSSDAFPLDSSESVDTDSDGVGNNADSDDDNDGVADSSDAFPLDSSESVDTDSDGIGNNADSDDDNDGVADSSDAFPLDSSESVDTDSDGVGNNADSDDDNDGVADSSDAFPLDSSESVDTDSDGIGNNADNDDDNDGVTDSSDAFPLDASESADTDSDGIGDNSDNCPFGDVCEITTLQINATKDNSIDENSSKQHITYESQTRLSILTRDNSDGRIVGIVGFDLSSISGKEVISANLRLDVREFENQGSDTGIVNLFNIYGYSTAWSTDNVTWANRPGDPGVLIASQEVSNANTVYNFDVTSYLQNLSNSELSFWIEDGNASNRTVKVRANGASLTEDSPQLTITYLD